MKKIRKHHLKRIPLYLRTRWYLYRGQSKHTIGSPIFIIGSGRSGTSLLRRIVDTHPNIACPPESKFILPLEALVKHPLALEALSSMGFTRKIVISRLRSFAVGFFEDYAAVKRKSRWADKSPDYVDCLPFLDELFAGTAQYIAIVRHPFDVCLSYEDLANRGTLGYRFQPYLAQAPDIRAAACQFWNDQNLKISSFISMVADRVITVTYESLTKYPEPVLRQVFEFLGEPWDPKVLNFSSFAHDEGIGDDKILKMPKVIVNSGKFLTWPKAERLRLAAIAEEAMGIWGYDPNGLSRKPAMGDLGRTFVDHHLPSKEFEYVNKEGA